MEPKIGTDLVVTPSKQEHWCTWCRTHPAEACPADQNATTGVLSGMGPLPAMTMFFCSNGVTHVHAEEMIFTCEVHRHSWEHRSRMDRLVEWLTNRLVGQPS